ncbi:MAG: DNA topoisomerase (ATP-hydrolyzing) subunit A [Clostridiales bacterium]
MAVNSIEQKIVDTLEQNFMPYAMSVIVSRAIPEIDGLKPSHRKLLYTMYKMGLLNGNKTKSANVVGQTMKLNPHGDMAIYETLVRLTRGNEALLHALIESKGNFGKHFSKDMRFAAPRYTEVKLSKICNELFFDLDKNTVDFVNNYDGTLKEPILLPTKFPNILVCPNQGIAVGMASNICSFNLKEVCETTIEYLKNDNLNLIDYLKSPDFSTGGELIYNKNEINRIYSTGRGSFKLRAIYNYDNVKNCIEIKEIPYTTTIEAIIDSIIELVKKGKIRDVSDVRDETDLGGLKIALDLKRNVDAENLMNRLYKLTPLEDNFSTNFNMLIDGSPKVLGVKEILYEWTKFRIECIKRQLVFDIKKKSDKLHLLVGLEKILLDIDKAIKIIRETEQESMVMINLINGFEIDEIQAEYIAEIKLRNLNKEYILNRVKEKDNLNNEIKEFSEILESEKKIKRIITKQLREIMKKYGKDRLTKIIKEENIEEITQEHFIDDYKLKLFFTEHNYLKKIPMTSLRMNPEQKLKDDDKIIQEIEIKNKAEILCFSNKGNVYKLKIFEIEDCKASSLGEYLPNILRLNEDETILYMIATVDYEGDMIFCFKNGKVAKIKLSAYITKTNRKKLTKAYSVSSEIVKIIFIKEDIDLVAYSTIKKVLVFNTSSINSKTTRDSQGVQVIKSKKGSELLYIKFLDEVYLKDVKYYRTHNIPAIGYYLKDEDSLEYHEQLKIDKA